MFDERMSLVQLRIPESADSYKLANLGKFFQDAAVLPSLDTHVPTYQKGSTLVYGQPWQTGVRGAKYPRENTKEVRESLSMKKPCPESIR
jgi:hypothetical protein